jgi:hypothetical protein
MRHSAALSYCNEFFKIKVHKQYLQLYASEFNQNVDLSSISLIAISLLQTLKSNALVSKA